MAAPSSNSVLGVDNYIGRFAPSPSGPLHMGSLVCALASYLDAKAHHGQWLVRIEDIDPPREQPGATQNIISCLEAHGLTSERAILHQSQRSAAYDAALTQLHRRGLTYFCHCTRKRLKTLANGYDGYCRSAGHTSGAIRFNTAAAKQQGINITPALNDRFAHPQKPTDSQQLVSPPSDFIVHRKDGLYAYQLAVVVDDIEQNITHIVRGDDLLETTPNQAILYHAFGKPVPKLGHIPVLRNTDGSKLSKQTGAPGVDVSTPQDNLRYAFEYLSSQQPLRPALSHAASHLASHTPDHTPSIASSLKHAQSVNALLEQAVCIWRHQLQAGISIKS